jgi:DnaJ-class molecular chaperone
MSEDIYADWKARGWTQITCGACRGHGLVVTYSDPHGQDAECHDCGGAGALWRSATGAIAQYPGGPFRGREKVA